MSVERKRMVVEAVKALSSAKQDLPAIIAGGAGRFVQTARPIYKGEGLSFSDDDLRDIYDGLKIMWLASNPGARLNS